MYLIVGLGNPGQQYAHTRHNAGFDALAVLADKLNVSITRKKDEALIGECYIGTQKTLLCMPQTFMNLSGNAVRYWRDMEKIDPDNILVVVDDLALPFGAIRIKQRGSDAGHNDLKSIAQMLGTQNYARLRFGIGNDFPRGAQVDYVLGTFTPEQRKELPERIAVACDAIREYVLAGAGSAMCKYNNK